MTSAIIASNDFKNEEFFDQEVEQELDDFGVDASTSDMATSTNAPQDQDIGMPNSKVSADLNKNEQSITTRFKQKLDQNLDLFQENTKKIFQLRDKFQINNL